MMTCDISSLIFPNFLRIFSEDYLSPTFTVHNRRNYAWETGGVLKNAGATAGRQWKD